MKPFKKGQIISPEKMKEFEKREAGIPGETLIDCVDKSFGRVFSKVGKWLKDNW